MSGKNLRSQSGKKGVGMSAPGRPKLAAMPKQTTPTMFSSAGKLPKAKEPGIKAKLGMKKKG